MEELQKVLEEIEVLKKEIYELRKAFDIAMNIILPSDSGIIYQEK